MSTAREEILARIGAALGPSRAERTVPRAYHGAGEVTVPDPVALLTDRLLDYRAAVHRCGANEVTGTIEAVLADRGAGDIAVPTGFPAQWLPVGRTIDAAPRGVDALDGCDGVLTTCRLAIAMTGTLVLDAGPGQGTRAQTLIPDYHLVVLPAAQIVAAVPDALPLLDPRAALTWISGPSATSDIELERVEGVHGPRTLEVIIAE